MTNFERMKEIKTEKEMARIIRRLYEEWLAFALNNESVEKGLIKWLQSEVSQ